MSLPSSRGSTRPAGTPARARARARARAPWWLLPLGLAILLGALTAAVLLTHGGPLPGDLEWHDAMKASAADWVVSTARILNVVGGTASMAVVTAAAAGGLLFAARRTQSRVFPDPEPSRTPTQSPRQTPRPAPAHTPWRSPLALITAVAVAAVCSEIIKLLVQRPRPEDALVFARGDSFPSGHTTAAAAFAVALVLLMRRTWLWVLACGWVVLMAMSRTVLLVHWASDTLAGAALGTAVALLAVRAWAPPPGLTPAPRPGGKNPGVARASDLLS